MAVRPEVDERPSLPPPACTTVLCPPTPPGRAVEEAVRKSKAGHYQLACAAAFEGVHRVPDMDIGIQAPLQYYSGAGFGRGAWDVGCGQG